jgi:hypothetical protein
MSLTKKLKQFGALAGLIATVGCSDNVYNSESVNKNVPYPEIISGIPLSAESTNDGRYDGGSYIMETNLFIVLQNSNGEIILGGYNGVNDSGKTDRIKAVIQSEINDGDNQPIKLYGSFKDETQNEFSIGRVEANGFTVTLVKPRKMYSKAELKYLDEKVKPLAEVTSDTQLNPFGESQ